MKQSHTKDYFMALSFVLTQGIYENPCHDQKIARKLSLCKLLFQNEIRQQHDKHITERIYDRTIFHIYLRKGICIQK